MAFWNRELTRFIGNAVPQLLQIFNLLGLRELRKSGWFGNGGVLHRSTLPIRQYRSPIRLPMKWINDFFRAVCGRAHDFHLSKL
jgi:hypothetical protein